MERKMHITINKLKICNFIFVIFLVFEISGAQKSGLIINGIDTLWINKKIGFDFISQSACTTWNALYPNNSCYMHFYLNFYQDPNAHYDLRVPLGYAITLGRINLDSVKQAVSDSIFSTKSIGKIDSVPPEFLSSYIGNCYILKTGIDSRPAYKIPVFAKIKILKVIVLDSTSHQIKMVFLWAYNDDGTRDLKTTGLDTFHLDTPTLIQQNSRFANSMNHTYPNQYVFKVIGDKFVLPRELVGKVKWLTVWDLKGRELGRIEVGNLNGNIDLKRFVKLSGGIGVVRLEK
jgi:hypothetical protein